MSDSLAWWALPVLAACMVVLAVVWLRSRHRAWDWDVDLSQNVGA